jgi:hypothetical protein
VESEKKNKNNKLSLRFKNLFDRLLMKEGIMKKSLVIFREVMILSLFIMGMNQHISAQVAQQDSVALVALYNSTDGANWTDNTTWLTVQPVSDWFGITATNGRVSAIILNNNNLSGTIPPEIGDLTNLTDLQFFLNQLSGSLPSTIGNLLNLTNLYLSANQLSGAIPTEIGNLVNLETLNIGSNDFSEAIPAEIGELVNLTSLVIANCNLAGPIPEEIGDLTSLVFINLNNNQLSDSIPAVIGNLSNLLQLRLSNNQLTGTIPSGIRNSNIINILDLGRNLLSGPIPADISNMTGLEGLILDNNNFSGDIPGGIGDLSNMKWLYLNGNKLSGAVPTEFQNLSSLQEFRLNDNFLADLPDLSTLADLSTLRIQNNQFTFEDIEPNIGISSFTYSPQDSVGLSRDTTLETGSSLTLEMIVGGANNQYQWKRNGVEIPGADSSTYIIQSVQFADSGSYICKITNTVATELTIYGRPVNVTVEGTVDITDRPTRIPKTLVLHQNYPNPFNPSTNIEYSVKVVGQVQIRIFNTLGHVVRTLVDERKLAGAYSTTWDGKDDLGQPVASGLYYYQLSAKDFTSAKKMLLSK